MVRLSCLSIVMLAVGCASESTPSVDGSVGAASLDASVDAPADVATLDVAPTGDAPEADHAPDAAAIDQAGATARIVVDPLLHEFASVVGCRTEPAEFRVTNSGPPSGPLKVVTGDDFPLVSDGCTGNEVGNGGFCTFGVGFRRNTAGRSTTTLTVEAQPGGTVQLALGGTAVAGSALTLSPNVADFGAIGIGHTSDMKSFELVNVSGADLQVGNVGFSSGEDFVLTKDGCGGRTLPSNMACQVDVAFRPQAFGGRTTNLRIFATGSCGDSSALATLQGSGVFADGKLLLTPSAVDFGEYCSSKPAVFTFTNGGPQTLWPITVHVSGGSFDLTRNGCVAALGPGQSCELEVQLRNTSYGAVTGTLTVSAPGGATVTATLAGVAPGLAEPSLALSSPIPSTIVGQKSPPVELVITNAAGAAPAKFGWTFTNVAAAEYSVADTDCTGTLAPGSSCRLHIVFAPAAMGVRNAALVVSAEGCPGGTGSVPLAGIGTTP